MAATSKTIVLDGKTLLLERQPRQEADGHVAKRPRTGPDAEIVGVRQALADGSRGPVVGRASGDLDQDPPSLEVDVDGFGGPYADELLESVALETHKELIGTVPEAALAALEQGRPGVWPHAVPIGTVRKIRDAVRRLPEPTLSRQNHGQDPTIRTDKVAFVNLPRRAAPGRDSADTVRECDEADDLDDVDLADLYAGFDLLEAVAEAVHKAGKSGCSTLLRPPHGMVAEYPGTGAAYTEHADNDRDESGRWRNYRGLTTILYLNDEDWADSDGGQLVCAAPPQAHQGAASESQEPSLVVQPAGGTVVVFNSRTVRHEVRAALRSRLAITMWFVTPDLLDDPRPPCGPRLRQLLGDAEGARKEAAAPASQAVGSAACALPLPVAQWTLGELGDDAPDADGAFAFRFFD